MSNWWTQNGNTLRIVNDWVAIFTDKNGLTLELIADNPETIKKIMKNVNEPHIDSDLVERMKVFIKSIEWFNYSKDTGNYFCLDCGYDRNPEGSHSTTCDIGNILKEIDNG